MERKRSNKPDSLTRMRQEADRLLLELTGADRVLRQASPVFRPHADVFFSKTANAVIVRMDLAGIDPAKIQLEAKGRMLRVRGERLDRERADKVYQQMEIDYGYFERMISLPTAVEAERAEAHYHNGFLEITLPVPAPTGSRTIPVNVRESGESDEEAVERETIGGPPEEDPGESGGRR